MEEQEKPSEKLLATAGKMIETYRDLVSLTVVEKLSLGVSLSAIGIVALVFLSLVMLFAGLGAAWWIGESMNNMKAGFFITGSAFLLLLLIAMLSAKKSLMPMIRDIVIKKIYEEPK